ncbi:phosphatase PAP2 family protein [Streptococcaceae bacterium ESL0687]|nr:phosphatase PAP2 family protein [Streptococcaceae bacterium ESL0687]
MKNKLYYQFAGSTLILIFIGLGYIIKFFPKMIANFDQPIQNFVFSHRSDSLTTFFETITKFGNSSRIIILVALFVIFFYFKKWYAEAVYLGGLLVVVSGIIAPLAKYLYQRPRPPFEDRLITESGYSFPSGHSTVSMLVFLTLILIFLPRIEKTWLKILLVTVLSLLIVTIGFSRIYLGVHYPSDVIGGFTLASAAVMYSYPYYDKIRFKLRFKGIQK